MSSFLPGKLFGQPHRALDGFRAAVGEKCFLQFAGRNLREAFGQQSCGRTVINVGATVDQFVHLGLRRRDDFRMTVTGVDDGDAAEAVEIRLTVAARDGRTLGALNLNRLEARHHAGDHILVVKFFRRHSSSS